MYLKWIFLCFISILSSRIALAQEDFVYENQVWLGYLTNTRISERISIWNDSHFVPQSFLIIRTGGTVHFTMGKKIRGTSTLGMAKLWLYSRSDQVPTRNEFRPWGQTTASFDVKKFTFTTRFRYDARFKQDIESNKLLNSYTFNWRLRYFLMIKYPISENKPKQTQWYVYSFDELLYDVGKNITDGFRLNQNRFTVGLGYKHRTMAFQLGYLNMIKNPPVAGNKVLAHTAMLMIFHNIDLRIKTKE